MWWRLRWKRGGEEEKEAEAEREGGTGLSGCEEEVEKI